MIRSPPRFPAPGRAQRTLRKPPDPGTTSPASGFCIRYCCSSEYSSSSKYAGSTRSKMDDSIKVNTSDYTPLAYLLQHIGRLTATLRLGKFERNGVKGEQRERHRNGRCLPSP